MTAKPLPDTRDHYAHCSPITTRWGDNDIYGHVNNVQYYSFFDTVVNRYLIEAGALDIHAGSVIGLAEDAKADVPASTVPATRVGGWAVQLGAFTTAEDANKLRARLQTGGFAGFVDKFSAENQTLWRVRVGPEVDRGNAEKLRDRIKEKMKLDGLVVSQP